MESNRISIYREHFVVNWLVKHYNTVSHTQSAFNCSKSTMETTKQCAKSVTVNKKDTKLTSMTSLFILNRFHILLCSHC